MSNVVAINGAEILDQREVSDVTVKLLETLLGKAQAGEINGIVGVTLYHDNSTGTFVEGNVYAQEVLGGLRILEYRILRSKET